VSWSGKDSVDLRAEKAWSAALVIKKIVFPPQRPPTPASLLTDLPSQQGFRDPDRFPLTTSSCPWISSRGAIPRRQSQLWLTLSEASTEIIVCRNITEFFAAMRNGNPIDSSKAGKPRFLLERRIWSGRGSESRLKTPRPSTLCLRRPRRRASRRRRCTALATVLAPATKIHRDEVAASPSRHRPF